MTTELIVGGLGLAAAVVGYLETRFRMSSISAKVKAEVVADARLAAATVLADAVLAAAKIKSDAKELVSRT
jgi:hypothetical protein